MSDIIPVVKRSYPAPGWAKTEQRAILDNPANWATVFSRGAVNSTLAGVSLDESSCLGHLPVFAAANRIATDMAVLDICLERIQASGGRRPAIDLRLNRVITFSPDGLITARAWRQTSVLHLLTWGNSYSEIEFDGAGNAIGLHLLLPEFVNPEIVNGAVVYQYLQPDGSGMVAIPANKMLHCHGLSHDGVKGLSPIRLARENLALGRAADLFGASFFANAARPSGFLKHPGKLSDQGKKNLLESFSERHTGVMSTGRVGLLEDGLDWVSATIPPDDAQFLETKESASLDVNKLFGLPSKDWADLESANANYLQTTLLGLCSMLESEIEFKCLLPEQQGVIRVRHDFRPLLRPNAVARAQYHATMIQWGVENKNEVRDDEGLEPVQGGDNFLVPLNFAMMTPEGEFILPPQPQQPAKQPGATASEDQTTQANTNLTNSNTNNSAKAVTAVTGIVRSELARAMRREVATFKRAAGKPGFASAIDSICAEHESYLAEALAPSLDALAAINGQTIDSQTVASDWVGESRRQMIELEAVTTADQRSDALDDLACRWEQRIAALIDSAWQIKEKSAA